MKSFTNFFFFLMLVALSSCDKVIEERYVTANVPLYMPYDEFRSTDAVRSESPKELVDPGKIYIYEDYLLVNEKGKGIHVINNSDPANPQKVSFISIPGNFDISVKSNILYADSYTDLLAIDISDPINIFITTRVPNAFTQAYFSSPDPRYPVVNIDDTKGVVIGWKVEYIEVLDDNVNWPSIPSGTILNAAGGSSGASFGGTGIGGSMARFAIVEDRLYALESTSLKVYNLSNPTTPSKIDEVSLNRNVETLFAYENNLFIGTTSGMLIYSLSNPDHPDFLSNFNHAESCDPVVVADGYAYVTLRSGTFCGGFRNQLDVIDIQNIHSPNLIKSYQMHQPAGLGIQNNVLFICDGDAGLKVYNATDKKNIDKNLIVVFQDLLAYDVIPFNNVLFLTAEEGIYQYDISDVYNIQLLSIIPAQ